MSTTEMFKIERTFEMDGIEKMFCLHGNWYTVAHVAHLTGDQELLISHVEHIIHQLLKRHTRFRSRLRIHRENSHHIRDPVTKVPYVVEQNFIDTFEYDNDLYSNPDVLKLFYKIHHADTENEWKQLTEDGCNRNPYNDDLTIIFPLFHFLFVLNKDQTDEFHMILFSNHSASDGQSGFIIINDYLTIASSQSYLKEDSVNHEFLPSVTSMVPRPFGIFFSTISRLIRLIYGQQVKHYHPKIPIHPTFAQENVDDERFPFFQPIKTNFLFHSSTKEYYQRLKDACHARKITLHGPLFACLILTVNQCFLLKSQKKLTQHQKLKKFDIELDYNLRERLPQSKLTKQSIGYYIGVSSGHFSHVHLRTRFWSFARACMKKTHRSMERGEVFLLMHAFNDVINDKKMFFKVIRNCENGALSEMNFSNVGKFPFDRASYGDNLKLKGIHVANNGSIYHTSSIMYASCVEQLDFTLAHEWLDDKQQPEQFMKQYIHLIEKCSQFDDDMTLYDVLSKEQIEPNN